MALSALVIEGIVEGVRSEGLTGKEVVIDLESYLGGECEKSCGVLDHFQGRVAKRNI